MVSTTTISKGGVKTVIVRRSAAEGGTYSYEVKNKKTVKGSYRGGSNNADERIASEKEVGTYQEPVNQTASAQVKQGLAGTTTTTTTTKTTQMIADPLSNSQNSFLLNAGGYSPVPNAAPSYLALARSSQEIASKDDGQNTSLLIDRKIGKPLKSLGTKLQIASQKSYDASRATQEIYFDGKTGTFKQGTKINLLSNVEAAKSYAYGFAGDVVSGAGFLFDTQQSGRELKQAVTSLYNEPIKTIATASSSLGESFQTNPYGFAGSVTGDLAIAKGASQGAKIVTDTATDLYVGAGSKFVEPEKVFAKSVLEGKERLPTTKSTAQSLSEFSKGKTETGFVVQTASPAAIKGDTIGSGRKGAFDLEDAGLYVTPEGQGSPYFLRVSDDIPVASYEVSLNPFKNIGVPTVTKVEVSGIKKAPSSLTSKAGFSELNKFYKEKASAGGSAYITKRSQIGQGEILRQYYEAATDYTSPIPTTVTRDGVVLKGQTNIKKGDILREAGTSELEGVIPVGTKIVASQPKTFIGKLKGFDEYTTFEGRKVAIRETKTLITDGSNLDLSVSKSSGGKVSIPKIQKGQDLISDITSPIKKTNPLSLGSPAVSKISKISTPSASVSPKYSYPSQSTPYGFSYVGSDVSYSFPYKPNPSSPIGSSGGSSSIGSSGGGSSGGISGGSSSSFTSSLISGSESSSPLKLSKLFKVSDFEFNPLKTTSKTTSKKQKRVYTPTLFSVVGDIKSKQTTTLGGVGLRPINY